MKGKNEPLILASNVLLILSVVLVVLWPVTGAGLWGILALAALLLSASFGGMNISARGRRNAARHEHGPDGGHA